jgi:hypothetical protein
MRQSFWVPQPCFDPMWSWIDNLLLNYLLCAFPTNKCQYFLVFLVAMMLRNQIFFAIYFTQILCCCNLFLNCPSSYLHPLVLANFLMILLGFLNLSSSYLFVHVILLNYLKQEGRRSNTSKLERQQHQWLQQNG